ncbi:hypothetical protein [Bacillus sp. OV322]|uniref:hypothetical protein n=1 Tax=Bacillus sp. OV322 TaxID=1882764 RepID=UPI0015A56BD4|nr:hypothetical protein [Bacillus sp. OV322]
MRVKSMEKKYCRHCKTLLNDEQYCHVCGKADFQKIIIEVQNGSSSAKEIE